MNDAPTAGERAAAAAVEHLRVWGARGGVRRALVRRVRVDGVEYLLLGRTMPRDRGTQRSEIWLVRCVDAERIALGFDSPETVGAALGSDLTEPVGRALSREVGGVVYAGEAREVFASMALAATFDPLSGAEILQLSDEPWAEPPTSQQLQQRARRAEAVARGKVTVTYDGSYTKLVNGSAHVD